MQSSPYQLAPADSTSATFTLPGRIKRRWKGIERFFLVLVSLCLAGFAVILGYTAWEWLGAAIGFGLAFAGVAWHQLSQKPNVNILVMGEGTRGNLEIRFGKRKIQLRLQSLRKVILDTEATHYMDRFANQLRVGRTTRVGNETRIVFVTDEDGIEPKIPLTHEHGSYAIVSEDFQNVRRFLRSRGWIPDDERDDEAIDRAWVLPSRVDAQFRPVFRGKRRMGPM